MQTTDKSWTNQFELVTRSPTVSWILPPNAIGDAVPIIMPFSCTVCFFPLWMGLTSTQACYEFVHPLKILPRPRIPCSCCPIPLLAKLPVGQVPSSAKCVPPDTGLHAATIQHSRLQFMDLNADSLHEPKISHAESRSG